MSPYLIRVLAPPADAAGNCHPAYPQGHVWQAHLRDPKWVYRSATEVTLGVLFQCLICGYLTDARVP